MNIVDMIEKYNLSIRRIPDYVSGIYDMRNFKEGDEVIDYNGRKMARRKTIPKHHGYYMVKAENNTSNLVQWSYKRDNLAPTLEESINLFLKNLSN